MPQATSNVSKGLLKSLYDFSFSSLVTPKVVRILYVIITILYSHGAIGLFIDLVSKGGPYVVAAIIVVPLGYLLYLTLARISLEFIIVVFRIGEDVRDIRDARGWSQETASPHSPQESAAEQPSQTSNTYPAGWYNDPTGVARVRYWDGQGWTEHTQT